MSSITPRPKKHDGGKQPNKSRARQDFITLREGLTEVFISWRTGTRMPQAFHMTEAEAVGLAQERCAAGETINILRAEIVGQVSSPAPVVTYIRDVSKK